MRADMGYLRKVTFGLAIGLFLGACNDSARAQSLPTSEQFSDLLRSCAAGADINLSADLQGSLKTIYEGQRTQGAASFKSSTEFLKLIPENQRLEAYKVYAQCVQ